MSRVIKIDEAATLLGVNPRTISKWVKWGELKQVLKGGRNKILLESVLEKKKQREIEAEESGDIDLETLDEYAIAVDVWEHAFTPKTIGQLSAATGIIESKIEHIVNVLRPDLFVLADGKIQSVMLDYDDEEEREKREIHKRKKRKQCPEKIQPSKVIVAAVSGT